MMEPSLKKVNSLFGFAHLDERTGGQPKRILSPASGADNADHNGFTSKISTSDL